MKRCAGLLRSPSLSRLGRLRWWRKGSNTTPIAIVGPVTGQYASFGHQMTNGG